MNSMPEQILAASVMLDTNVFILGQKRPEHHKLKNLHREGRIKLYVSFDLDLEQEGKLLRHMDGPTQDAILG